jgi:hypothetical protein
MGRFFAALDTPAIAAEKRTLRTDLAFPFFYGGALAASLLIGWWQLGRPFPPALVAVAVGALMCADWIENGIHLRQLSRFEHKQSLQEGWVLVASTATAAKLGLLAVCGLAVLAMAARMMFLTR